MGVKNIKIVLDNITSTYYAGQAVSGKLILLVNKPTKIKGIKIKFTGETSVHWSKTEHYTDKDGKTESKTVNYSGTESYFKDKYDLAGNGLKFEIATGEHAYNFSHILKSDLPSSYKGTYGGVNYYIKAKVVIPWSINKKAITQIEVHNPINLNDNPQSRNPSRNEKEKKFGLLFWKSDPLTVKVYIPKTGFGFGQSVPVTVEVNNRSNIFIRTVTCSLNQTVEWIVKYPSTEKKHSRDTLVKLELGNVPNRCSRTFNDNLIVPQRVLPNLTKCSFIKISHFIKVTADPKGNHFDLDVLIPVQLGDVPLIDEYRSNFGIDSSLPSYSDVVLPTFRY